MISCQFLAAWVRSRFDSDQGASLVEYAMLIALIAVVCLGAITLLGNNASSTFNSTAGSLG